MNSGKIDKKVSGNGHRRLRIAIAHVRLGWGGSEKRVLWGIQALKDHHDVTLITAGNYDLPALNQYYGTDLKPDDFLSIQVPLPFFMRNNGRMAAVRGALFQRFCRKIAADYDVLISGYGPTDFGRPAIHFIADFSWDQELRETLHPYPPGLIYHHQWIRKAYLGLAEYFERPSGRDLFSGQDLMLSVSPWVSRTMKSRYGVESPVLPSPVPGEFPVVPWEKKQLGFVCLGRLAPEKRIEDIIEILCGVRAKGHDIHLHIVGDGDNSAYLASLSRLVVEYKDWVSMEGRLQGEEKAALLSQHAFGIHACRGDAFPGALIEMMKAGCVVWAHDSGGQSDILEMSKLLYKNNKEATEKIDRMLWDANQLQQTQKRLLEFSEEYSVEHYMRDICSIVEEWKSA